MSDWGRVFFGSLFGCLVVILLHPITRAVVIDPFIRPADSIWSLSSREVPDLNTSEGAAFAALLVAQDQEDGIPVSGTLLEPIEAALRREARTDPENAFWLHAQVAILPLSDADLRMLWLRSANCKRWDDLQSGRIRRVANGDRPWRAALFVNERSRVLVDKIVEYAEGVLRTSSLSGEDLKFRIETIRIARVMRDGSRSIALGERSVYLMNRASRPPGAAQVLTVSNRLRQRQLFLDAVERELPGEERLQVERTLVDTDSWVRLLDDDNVGPLRRMVLLLAGIAAVFPAAALLSGGAGAIVGLLGAGLRRVPAILRPPWILFVSVAMGAGTFLGSGSALAGMASSLCLSLFAFRRDALRRAEPMVETRGILLLLTTGLPFLGCLLFFFSGQSALAPIFNPTYPEVWVNLVGEPALVWVAVVLVCLTLGAVPLVSLRQRHDPALLAGPILQRFGFGIATLGLVLSVLGTLATLAIESQFSDSTWRLVQNEPVYFLSR